MFVARQTYGDEDGEQDEEGEGTEGTETDRQIWCWFLGRSGAPRTARVISPPTF